MTSLQGLGGNLRSKLPLILLVIVGLVNGGFALLMIVPHWQEHDVLAADAETRQTAVSRKIAEENDAKEVLEAQLESVQDQLNTAAALFLTEAEADSILDRLYNYAAISGVEITELLAQPPAEDGTPQPEAYHVLAYHLEIQGWVQRLMNFMVLLKEASAPSVTIDNLTITEGEAQSVLTIDILLYTSPHATAAVFETLPDVVTPTPVAPYPTQQPTATYTPTMTATPTATPTVTPTATPEVTITPTPAGPVVGVGTYDDNNAAIIYTKGTWEALDSLHGFEGSYHYSPDIDAEIQFSFVGTDVAVQYVAYKNFGIFEIWIDGELWGEVDSYAPEGTFGRLASITGLSHQMHTLIIRNTDRRNAVSEGNVLAIDAIHVMTPALQ